MTDVEISVFGKTIALIGYPEQLKTARAVIDTLIEGVPHENVFAFLDRKKKEEKQDMISYYYSYFECQSKSRIQHEQLPLGKYLKNMIYIFKSPALGLVF